MRLHSTERVRPKSHTDAIQGTIRWDAMKSIWFLFMLTGGVLAIIWTPSWSGFLVFLTTTAITVCAGHSVGMHRLLIHKSFETPKWLEYTLVWLGTLVGMAGPFGMIRAHDMRDWHQRQTVCPRHPSHGAGFWQDAWWQMHCRFDLDHPPQFEIEPEIANDRVYQWVERHWMAQQLVLAVPLFLIGGIEFVLWGVCLRVAVSLSGHWMVGHFAHKGGHQGWIVNGLPVQGYNLPSFAFITFGESLHGNHHAFPHSARLGIDEGQSDIGFTFIKCLEFFGLAKDIQEPHSRPEREGLTRANHYTESKPNTLPPSSDVVTSGAGFNSYREASKWNGN